MKKYLRADVVIITGFACLLGFGVYHKNKVEREKWEELERSQIESRIQDYNKALSKDDLLSSSTYAFTLSLNYRDIGDTITSKKWEELSRVQRQEHDDRESYKRNPLGFELIQREKMAEKYWEQQELKNQPVKNTPVVKPEPSGFEKFMDNFKPKSMRHGS